VARSAGDTNAAIFDRLSAYAADHDVVVPAGERRVYLGEADYDVLVDARRIAHFPIGRHQAAVLLETSNGNVLATAGFEAEAIQLSSYVRELNLPPGIAVAALADLEIEPTGGPLAVLDVVAAGRAGDAAYEGHDLVKVQALFPRLRVFEIDVEVAGVDKFDANLLTICAAEGVGGNGWIAKPLADELVRLAEQRIAGFPYEFLVMAALELDPRNLFLALYRCLEATYAFTRASELAVSLAVKDRSWIEIAKALGESLSWYPRHDQSLAAVLSLPAVNSDDLRALAVSLGKDADGTDVAARVSAGIRELRNSLVHYGPTTREVAIPDGDWNGLCTPLARVVGSVFAHTYAYVGADSSPLNPSLMSAISSAPEPARLTISKQAAATCQRVRELVRAKFGR
jgi:hypothetical protein